LRKTAFINLLQLASHWSFRHPPPPPPKPTWSHRIKNKPSLFQRGLILHLRIFQYYFNY
jgi:hypothetical protein